MAILYYAEDVKIPSIPKRETTKWVKEVVSKYKLIVGNVSYVFCSDEYILEINRKYLQHDYYTDIITFDYRNNLIISGDIFISVDTVKSNADKFRVSFEEELYRVIIHGILHLCGINDKTDEQQAEMTKQENEALALRIDVFERK